MALTADNTADFAVAAHTRTFTVTSAASYEVPAGHYARVAVVSQTTTTSRDITLNGVIFMGTQYSANVAHPIWNGIRLIAGDVIAVSSTGAMATIEEFSE